MLQKIKLFKMDKIKVLDVVKDATAKFAYACDGKIYYQIDNNGNSYIFPINLENKEDVGLTRFEPEYKAITLMRYVRKAIDSGDIVHYKTKQTA